MTNYEKIKNMSVEEMAKLINAIAVCCNNGADCEYCPIKCRTALYCNRSTIVKWLNSDVEE